MSEFSARELAACAQREVGFRVRVYEGRVLAGKMPRVTADREIAMMQAIASKLKEEAEAAAAKGDLFGGGR